MKVTYTHARPSKAAPFFYDSSPEAKAMVDAVASAEKAAKGFVDKDVAMSDDKLTNTVAVWWRSHGAYKSFEATHKDQLTAYRAARAAYQAKVGGSTTTKVTRN